MSRQLESRPTNKAEIPGPELLFLDGLDGNNYCSIGADPHERVNCIVNYEEIPVNSDRLKEPHGCFFTNYLRLTLVLGMLLIGYHDLYDAINYNSFVSSADYLRVCRHK